MKNRLALFVSLLTLVFAGYSSASENAPASQILSAELKADRLTVNVGDKHFTDYKISSDLKYPYFYPVNGPQSGKSITTETSEPYPHHHSLFFGCDRVNGGNYWQDKVRRGQIVSKGIRLIEKKGKRIAFENDCLWQRPGAESPFKDLRRVTITAPSEKIRLIDFDITLTALIDVRIEKTNHSLFSARVVPELSVKSGGTMINAHYGLTEKGTWGKHSPWMDYWGTRGEIVEGIAILCHPGNPWHPPQWFTRDYGFFSPTPMYWPENDAIELSKGKTLRLQYRVVAHQGDTQDAGIAELFNAYQTADR